jgi:hypothetical protein
VPAPIVVEVYAPQPRPQELAVLISACSRAAAPNECITAETRPADSPLGVAIVRRDGDRARIELGLRGVVSAEWSTRDLVFQPNDDELERYRAIGFAIGTLVARETEPPPPPPPPAQVASEPPPPPAPSAAPPSAQRSVPKKKTERARSRATWLDLAGGVGLGLIPGPPRTGGTLRAASEVIPGGLFAAAETGYAERLGDPSLRARWLSFGLGVGHPLLAGERVGVEARLSFVLERLSLTAYDANRPPDGASRWKPGVSVAVDAHWEVARPLGLLLSANTHVDPEHTVVNTHDTPVAETPALGFGGFLGVRLKLR